MARNIKRLSQEIVSYINDFIVKDDPCVASASLLGKEANLTHHGTGIQIFPKETDEIAELRKNAEGSDNGMAEGSLGAIFYVEDMLSENPDATAAALAESLRQRYHDFYPKVLVATKNILSGKILRKLSEILGSKDLMDRVLLTAVPIRRVNWDDYQGGDPPLCAAQDESLGLNYMVKCDVSEQFGEDISVSEEERGTRVAPVLNDTGLPVPQKLWRKAWKKYLKSMAVQFTPSPVMPWMVIAQDFNSNSEFFYLIDAKGLFEKIRKWVPGHIGIDKMTIVPVSDFMCTVLLHGSIVKRNVTRKEGFKAVVDYVFQNSLKDVPIYEYDAASGNLYPAQEYYCIPVPGRKSVTAKQRKG